MGTISTKFVKDKVNGISVNAEYPCNPSNYDAKTSRTVSYITIHYTGNKSDTPLSNVKYFQGANRKASAHFFVKDNQIYQSVGLSDVAWSIGCSKGYKNSARNSNQVSIEMCTSGNYSNSKATIHTTAYLTAYLCKMIGITSDTVDKYVVRHYDCVKTDKCCPRDMVNNPDNWKSFKDNVKVLLNGDTQQTSRYTQSDFCNDVMHILGTATKISTLSKTVTVSRYSNSRHALVTPIERYLKAEGFYSGTIEADNNTLPLFGAKLEAAVKNYQARYGLVSDGEITKGANTWRKMLGLI